MRFIASILVFLAISGCASNIPKDVNLDWQYEHSIDVAQFKILRSLSVQLVGEKCDSIVWELEAIRTFKGGLRHGDTIQVWGPNDPKLWEAGTERLMFLRMYDGESYDACSKHLFSSFKQVHWGCCEIVGAGDNSTVLFPTELNSEESGPDIPVNAKEVFKVLRSYNHRSP